ncbi:MAG: hypothetical protein IKB82_01865, partial [Clostridia bacterium]|nr:hypothetical protein [Clostridia bacterium]
MNRRFKKVVSLVLAVSMMISPMPASLEIAETNSEIFAGETTGLFVQFEDVNYEVFQVPSEDGEAQFCILMDGQIVVLEGEIVEQLKQMLSGTIGDSTELPPVEEESVIEEPIVEEPVVEEPVVEEPVIEEPIVEEPVIEEPVIEEPVIEEPIVEEPIVEEPIVEEPVSEEPVIEEPVVEE